MPYWSPSAASPATAATLLALGIPPYNYLTNPGLDIWQRGAGAFTASLAYGPDRWQILLAGTDTLSLAREAAVVSPDSLYSCAATMVLGTGAGATRLRQHLAISTDEPSQYGLRGQTLTFAAQVRTNVAAAVRAFIETDGVGGTTTFSGFHTGGATFESLIITLAAVPAGATYVRVGLAFALGSVVYLDDAILLIGTVTTNPYRALAPSEDIERCQRYYEATVGGAGTFPVVYSSAVVAGQSVGNAISWPTRKAIAPTVTISGTWAVNANNGQPAAANRTIWGYLLYVTSVALGAVSAEPNSADDTVTSEANP